MLLPNPCINKAQLKASGTQKCRRDDRGTEAERRSSRTRFCPIQAITKLANAASVVATSVDTGLSAVMTYLQIANPPYIPKKAPAKAMLNQKERGTDSRWEEGQNLSLYIEHHFRQELRDTQNNKRENRVSPQLERVRVHFTFSRQKV